MFKQALLPDTLRAIQLAAKVIGNKPIYLAGGTALALHLGHRISTDLDFFTQEAFDERVMAQDLSRYNEFKLEGKAWRTVWGRLGKTKFSLFYYQYPLLQKAEEFEGLRVASKEDIAAMKVEAIADRGTKRDFVDLYFLIQEYSLDKILKFYDQKYRVLENKLYHILRSLSYFEEADREVKVPQMLRDVSWDEVKFFFERETRRLVRVRLTGSRWKDYK